MLNLFYNTQEELFVQNESALSYFLSSDIEETTLESETGLVSNFEMKTYGLLKVAIVKSSLKNDTISSAHFVGHYANSQTAIYMTNFSNALSYAGNVKLIGDKVLPVKSVREKYINGIINNLSSEGKIDLSESQLPSISEDLKKDYKSIKSRLVSLKDLERENDSVYFNSFFNETLAIEVGYNTLSHKVIKGNFIIIAKDSMAVDETVVLEDVILQSPIIKIKKGFKGSIQAFASKKIVLENEITLRYPSIVSVYNETDDESEIFIGENSTIYGAIILFGSPMLKIDYNKIELSEKTLVIGDIYCSGKLMIGGAVYGSVFTNRLFSKTKSATYENCIINAEINILKRPDYFISVPLFKSKSEAFGTIKKIL
ncbi:hypothetical protein [Flavobacterium sp.]|uniref:hypothetical protein n=1 Tax=Flavobacterium sp. TaxID=239 RepID=UPI0039193601